MDIYRVKTYTFTVNIRKFFIGKNNSDDFNFGYSCPKTLYLTAA